MRTLQTLLPHISRFISAGMVVLWLTILTQNILVYSTSPPFSSSFYNHSTSIPVVLGAESEQELASWKKIIEKHPEYPDAYLMAAVSSIKEQQKEQARTFTNSLLERDPNNAIGQQLLRLLEESY